MICPNCGEDNASNFRFCGMCGTPLEARKPVGAPRVASTTETPRTAQSQAEELRTPVAASAPIRADRAMPSASTPSFLGLNQSYEDRNRTDYKAGGPQDQPFSGLDSFFEPDEPKVGSRRIFLLLVLLVALGAGGWWAFANYDKTGAANAIKSETAAMKTESTAAAPNNPVSNNPVSSNLESNPKTTTDTIPATIAAPAQPSPPTAAERQNPSPAAEVEQKPEPKAEPNLNQNASTAAHPAEEPRAPREQTIARAENRVKPRPSATTPAADDNGEAAFRKGEAYLYGQGVPENCEEATRNLKASAAKQNSKARSILGTMYDTGHCVPRDLPTAYSWFALALRADPNNQILNKDLTAIWNQMTPPERQLATRMKQ